MQVHNIVKWSLKAAIAGVLALVILSVFVCFYHYDGVHISNVGQGTDYKWESGQLKSQMTEGFSWFFMDSNGFNNEKAIVENIDILLMGSSPMEGCEVKQSENVGALLNTGLSNLATYNIGMGGHTIYRCVDNLADALDIYKPEKYIIIETDKISLDIKNMSKVLDELAEAIPSYDSGFMYYLQKIPAVKLIYNQIDNWISLEEKTKTVTSSPKSVSIPEDYGNVLEQFLAYASKSAEGMGCQLIIFYHPAMGLQSDGTLNFQTDETRLEVFEAACDDNGIVFLNMTEDFADFYNSQHILARGFANTSVGVGHLNKYGHRLIADKLIQVITDLEESDE